MQNNTGDAESNGSELILDDLPFLSEFITEFYLYLRAT